MLCGRNKLYEYQKKLDVAEMSILRWMMGRIGKTRRERTRNKRIRDRAGIVEASKKAQERRLPNEKKGKPRRKKNAGPSDRRKESHGKTEEKELTRGHWDQERVELGN